MPPFYFLHKYAYIGNINSIIEFQIMNIIENKFFPPLNEVLKLTNHSTAIAAVTIVTGQLTTN